MAGHKFFFVFVGLVLIVKINVINSYAWHDPTFQRYHQGQQFQQQSRQRGTYGPQNNIEIVQGTIDQLGQIDANWVCTNPKTGDQMIIGTERGNGISVNNNAYPDQNLPTGNANQWNVQRPYRGPYNNPGQRVYEYDPHGQSPGYNPQGQLPGHDQHGQLTGYNPQGQLSDNSAQGQLSGYNPSQQPENPLQIQQPQNPEIATVSPVIGQDKVSSYPVQTTVVDVEKKFDNFDWTQYVTKKPVTSSMPSNLVEFDGQGILEARSLGKET